MKRIHTLFPVLLLSCLAVLLNGCQKDPDNLLETDPLRPPVVDAGVAQSVQLPIATVTLTGTATSTNGRITGYLWSLVAGPNIPNIHTPGARVTNISNLVAGSYLFQLMATDSAGLTGFDTTRINVAPPIIQTLTLQPANSSTEAFVVLHGTNPLTDPAHIEIPAGAWTSGGQPYLMRSVFKFDLSTIPTTATVLTASLSLYSNPAPLNGNGVNANFGTNNAMFIRRLTNTWAPATINWNNMPATSTTDQVSIPHTASSTLDLVDVDVRNMVANMVSSGNHGFAIQIQNETAFNIRNFSSSRSADATKRPKLVITYTP